LRLRHGGVDASKLICSLLFIPVAVEPGPMAAMRPTLGVGWTLNYEMMFYACFGLVLFLPRRRGLTLLILGMAGLVLAGSFAKPLTDTRDPTTLLAFYGAPIILLFGIGVLIGAGAHHLAVARTVRSSALVVAAVAALLAADSTIFATFVDAHPAGITWLLASWLVCAICVVLCVTIRVDGTGRFARALVQLGDASYSLYLFHFFAIDAVEKLWWLVFGENGSWAFVVLASAAAVLFSTLIHLLIEKPTTDRLRRASASATARHSARADNVQFETLQSTAPSGSTYLPDIAHKRSR
jgi:exopolysaccharide production protein ExoZ